MLVKRKLYSVMDEEGNLGYYLYDENSGEEKLFSVVEDEKLYFLGEHKGKFGKGGTASGVVFTGKDVLKEGADARLLLGPKGTNGGKVLDYANLENGLKQKKVFNDTFKNLTRKGVEHDPTFLSAKNAADSAFNHNRYKTVNKAIKKQKFNRSSLGKVLKKVKIR